MKNLFWITIMLLVAMALSFGQSMNYGYEGPFPPSDSGRLTIGGVINGGLGVDPAGKVWIQTRTENTTRDSIDTEGGGKARLFPIYVFNPNGDQAGFSPIKILTGPDPNSVTVTDTLIRGGATGGSINPSNGNFMAVWGTLSYKPGPLLWEIDYNTGEGARRVLLPLGTLQNNIASIAANQDGEYYAASVLGGTPGIILNPDGTAGSNFAESVPDIGRAIAVSPDGNDIYIPRFTTLKTLVYHSDQGSLGTYALTDSIFIGAGVECIAIHPVTGYVWMVAGANAGNTWTVNTAYAYDPTTKAIVDSFHISAWDAGLATSLLPRGIAFSPTGDTVYVGHFNATAFPAVVRFIKDFGTSVKRDPHIVPSGYELSQNYPNPFNPSTQIKFTIANEGMTTLKVYDVMGREIASLVNERLNAGGYTVNFNAATLPSGTYVYVLTSGTQRLTNKMLLVK